MSKLPPNLSGLQIIKVLCKIGFEIDHQTGSHIILRHKEKLHRRLTVPNHREISKGTLRAIIEQAGLSQKEFLDLLK